MKTDQFYTVKTLAEKLAVQPLTIYRLVGEGKISAVRIGRVLRFEPSAVDAFLQSVRVGPQGLSEPEPAPTPVKAPKNGKAEGRKA